MNDLGIFKTIYKEILKNTFSQSYYVFLCGGAGDNKVRNKVRILLEAKNLQILYPEDLITDMMNRNKKTDLFEFENLLAKNSDIICVICESMGSAVELGAFVQNMDIRSKMVAAIQTKYSRKKSFITMGPLKLLLKQNKSGVVYYKVNEIDAFADELEKAFISIKRKNNKLLSNITFDNLAAYISFIPMILWFYKFMSRKKLFDNIKTLLIDESMMPASYNELFNASIKYLLKVRTIIADYNSESGDEVYILSNNGCENVQKVLSKSILVNSTLLHDHIRCDILKKQLNNK